jgi:hypothetical protein
MSMPETVERGSCIGASQQTLSSFLNTDELRTETLPKSFLEFCCRSIKSRRGDFLYTDRPPENSSHAGAEEECSSLDLGEVDCSDVISLTPKPSTRRVAAIDTSTIKLGELEDGSLCAIRGVCVILQDHRYQYVRYGPFLFSISSFRAVEDFAQLGIAPTMNELNVECLLRRVRDTLEHWLQFNLNQTLSNAIILLDGSLTSGTPEPSRELERIFNAARQGKNLIIAISKSTRLRIGEKSITDLLEKSKNPCLLDIDDQVVRQFSSHPLRFIGRVFVGKLAEPGFPFRMDVDRQANAETMLDGFRELIGTEIVDQGYPETLRLAHILSTFTATDVLALQAFAASSFGIQLIPNPKTVLRRSLFGPFGTSWEAWH